MAAIGQIDPAGTASIRGLGPGTSVNGLAGNDEQDALNRVEDAERAQQRADGATEIPLGGQEQADTGVAQAGANANANQAGATEQSGDDTDTQSILQNVTATADQQLPTPFDPSRGTQLDIAV